MYQEHQLQGASTVCGRQTGQVNAIKLKSVLCPETEIACLDLCIVCFHRILLLLEDFCWLKLILDVVKVPYSLKGQEIVTLPYYVIKQ